MAARDEALPALHGRRAGPPVGVRYLLNRYARNRLALWGLWVVTGVVLAAVLAPALAPADPTKTDFGALLQPPSRAHLLGTDDLGRDILSRVIYGARTSLLAGVIAVGLAVAVGVPLGLLSGYFRGRLDNVLMRVTDGMMAIPYFFLVLIVVAVFGSSFRNIVLVIGVTSWMVVARIVRSEVLRTRELDFVLAARALGASSTRILLRHILPHAVPSIIVAATLGVANAILLESALSYLGLGIQPPQASWGNMLSNSQAYLWENPLLPLYPGLLILLTVLAYNFLGDALRDALDPQYREGQL